MSITKHDGKFVIQCTAEANHYAPQISWILNHGPEILGKLDSELRINSKLHFD